MILNDIWEIAQRHVFSVHAGEGLFNPYLDEDPDLDCEDAAAIRRKNFFNYLKVYKRKPAVFLLAEAPGPWGCRFSGVPLVAEEQLCDPSFPVSGRQTSRAEQPHKEYSARIYWRVLGPYFPAFFTWNSVPYHPFKKGKPLSIRTPGVAEIRAFSPVVAQLSEALSPQIHLAIGRKAESVFNMLGISCTYIRHPSQGGAVLFEEGVLDAMKQAGIEPNPSSS